MAFPTVVDAPLATIKDDAGTTAPVINFPTTTAVQAGDLIIGAICSDNGNSVTNWGAAGGTLTQLRNANFNGSAAFHGIGARVCTGGETSVTLTWSSERAAMMAIKIGAGTWEGTIAGGVFLSTGSEQSSTGPNGDNAAPGWGALDILWITLSFHDGTLTSITTWPANYTANQTTAAAASGGGIALATRELNAAAEDPGAFLLSGAKATMTVTIGIRPASAGGSGQPGRLTNGGLLAGRMVGGRLAA